MSNYPGKMNDAPYRDRQRALDRGEEEASAWYEVPCTYCGRPIGEPCRGSNKIYLMSVHWPRRLAATKKRRNA